LVYRLAGGCGGGGCGGGGWGGGGLGHHPVPLLRLLTPAVPCLVEPGLAVRILARPLVNPGRGCGGVARREVLAGPVGVSGAGRGHEGTTRQPVRNFL